MKVRSGFGIGSLKFAQKSKNYKTIKFYQVLIKYLFVKFRLISLLYPPREFQEKKRERKQQRNLDFIRQMKSENLASVGIEIAIFERFSSQSSTVFEMVKQKNVD